MNEEKSAAIQSVNNPLGFFALALLTVEGFLGIVLIFARDPHPVDLSSWGMWIGAGLFLAVVIIVSILTWFKPDALGLSGKDYLDMRRKESELQAKQTLPTPESEVGIVAGSAQETSEFETLKTFLVWNSQVALKWFNDQPGPVGENFFLASYALPYPPAVSSPENLLHEKAAVLVALKTKEMLEVDVDNRLKISAKGKRFLKFIGF
jgi:hypothetical protein